MSYIVFQSKVQVYIPNINFFVVWAYLFIICDLYSETFDSR
jgi:hypothetical protein